MLSYATVQEKQHLKIDIIIIYSIIINITYLSSSSHYLAFSLVGIPIVLLLF